MFNGRLDREIDLVTPMVTPLTYEGLINEIIGIENCRIKIDASIAGDEKDETGQATARPTNIVSSTIASSTSSKKSSPSATIASASEKVSVILDSNDLVFSEVRNLSIERLGESLEVNTCSWHDMINRDDSAR